MNENLKVEEKVVVTKTEEVAAVPTKVKFLALNSPTPEVWRNAFRITSVVTTVLAFWIAGTNLVTEIYKVEVLLALKTLDMLVFGIGRTFGVVPDEQKIEEDEKGS